MLILTLLTAAPLIAQCIKTDYERSTTIKKVATGPRTSEIGHQARPERPLLWASPALIRDSVNHPTAYSALGFIGNF